MASQEPVDTERSVVTTYVPAYQKEAWKTHAEELDMSLSEFVRSMVQAGRRGFGAPEETGDSRHADDGRPADAEEPPVADATPGGDIRRMVLQALDEDGPLTGEEIVEAVVGEWRSDIGDTLEQLETSGSIRRPALGNEFELVE